MPVDYITLEFRDVAAAAAAAAASVCLVSCRESLLSVQHDHSL